MKTILFLLFIVPLISFSQVDKETMIIKTKMSTRIFGRNQTLVLMRETQWQGVQLDFSSLNYKISLLSEEVRLRDSLIEDYQKKEKITKLTIKALEQIAIEKIQIADSLQRKMDSIQKYWKEKSVGGALVYMGKKEKIQIVDLTCYSFRSSLTSGTISLMRRGPNLFYKDYDKENWSNLGGQGNEWLFTINPINMPRVEPYPHSDRAPLKNKFKR
jgi:hypothetical protein